MDEYTTRPATPKDSSAVEEVLKASYPALIVATCNRKRLNLQSTPLSDRNYVQLKSVQTGIIRN